MNYNQTTLANIEHLLLGQKSVMNIDEVARYTGLSKSCLYKWTSEKRFPFSRPNGKKIFVKRQDIDDFLLSNPIMPGDDIEAEAISYLNGRPIKEVIK